MYGNKEVISFDIFGYPAGDDMNDIAGVNYVASLDDIAKECQNSIIEKYYVRQSLSDVVNQDLILFQ